MDPLSISLYSIHSGQMRTTLGIASFAVTVIGFAKFYQDVGKSGITKLMIYILGVALLITAITYGFNFSTNFIQVIEDAKRRLEVSKNSSTNQSRYNLLLTSWQREAYFHILLISILALFGFPYIIVIAYKSFNRLQSYGLQKRLILLRK